MPVTKKNKSKHFLRNFVFDHVRMTNTIFMRLSRDWVQVEVVMLLLAGIERIKMTLSSSHFQD